MTISLSWAGTRCWPRSSFSRFAAPLPSICLLRCLFEAPTVFKLAKIIAEVQQAGTLAVLDRPAVDLAGEAQLDPRSMGDISHIPPAPSLSRCSSPERPGSWAHILAKLLQRTRTIVYCLTRAATVDAAWQKLAEALERYCPGAHLPLDRVVPVLGDLSKPGLAWMRPATTRLRRVPSRSSTLGRGSTLPTPTQALKAVNVSGNSGGAAAGGSAAPESSTLHLNLSVFAPEIYYSGARIGEDDALAPPDRYRGLCAKQMGCRTAGHKRRARRHIPTDDLPARLYRWRQRYRY